MPKKPDPKPDETERQAVPASDEKPLEAPQTQAVTVTHGGAEYTYDIDLAAADDFELLDDLAQLDEGDQSRLPSILRRLIGSDQMRVAMDRLRDEQTGRVTRDAGSQLVFDLMRGFSGNS